MTLQAFLIQVGALAALSLLLLHVMARRQRSGSRKARRDGASLPSTPQPDPQLQSPVSVDGSWTPEQCAEVFERLKSGQEFQFFAADHRSPTDPGGYVRVQRSAADILIRKVANQGWSSFWERKDLAELRDELYRNRTAQTITINRAVLIAAYRQAAEGNR